MRQSLRISCLAGFLATIGGAATGHEPLEFEGRWEVVSVELAGVPVPGLEGCELVLADGKKAFTLPDKTIEEGTYKLDATKKPAEIDVTTSGRDGTEKGIFEVKGNSLKLCLASKGGARPTEFTTKMGTDQILIVLTRVGAVPAETPTDKLGEKPTGIRTFRMGFTGFVYDITPEASTASRKFVRENGDILAHHIEGVPWAEVAERPNRSPRPCSTNGRARNRRPRPTGKCIWPFRPAGAT